MPPKFKFTREEIIQAALDLTRESGIAAVTARGLGAKLGSSVKPIFSLFEYGRSTKRSPEGGGKIEPSPHTGDYGKRSISSL